MPNEKLKTEKNYLTFIGTRQETISLVINGVKCEKFKKLEFDFKDNDISNNKTFVNLWLDEIQTWRKLVDNLFGAIESKVAIDAEKNLSYSIAFYLDFTQAMELVKWVQNDKP